MSSSWKSLKSSIIKKKKDTSDSAPEDQGAGSQPEDNTSKDSISDAPEESSGGKEIDFTEPDTPDLVFVKQEGSKLPLVKAGTTDRLIERTVPEKYPDPDYLSQFLLTYRSFTTPETILEKLIAKFQEAPPPNATPEQAEEFKKSQIPVRIRITNVIKTWLGKKHSYDLHEYSPLIDRIEEFITIIAQAGMEKQAQLLRDCLEKHRYYQVDFVASTTPPKPIIPTGSGPLTLYDIDPLELARQITLIEFDLYKAICPNECLNQSWNKKGKEQNSPNVLKMIHWFNDISGWVNTEILKKESPKERADVIKMFLKIAQNCLEIRNYNAIYEILAGLQSSAVDRLKKTWEKLDNSSKKIHKALLEQTSSQHNSKALREALKIALPPCIPYLGLFLTDLTFLDQGNPDRVTSEVIEGGLINFVKLRKTAIVISHIQHFQQTGYCEQAVPSIRDYLLSVGKRNLSEDDGYKLSLQWEPRTG